VTTPEREFPLIGFIDLRLLLNCRVILGHRSQQFSERSGAVRRTVAGRTVVANNPGAQV
jgi:hypothetical protein